MSGPDIHQLQNENFPTGEFPVKAHSDFRLSISSTVHRGIREHAAIDTSIEICGVLVGQWQKDENGPFASVTEYIRCNQAASKFAEVTFTHESWSHINNEMDSRYSELRIIGWYHSHPDFGIFLSERDVFIQENFFSGPGQVAYVVDPVRKLEGVFEWRNGKPVLMNHYWAGEKVWSIDASENLMDQSGISLHHSSEQSSTDTTTFRETPPLLKNSTQLLIGLCLFLIGYLLAGTRSRWEQEMIVTGAVEHYGVNKLIKPGFEDKLIEVNQRILKVNQMFKALPTSLPESATESQIKEEQKNRAFISQSLVLCSQALSMIHAQYGLTDLERRALTRYIKRKQRELKNLPGPESKSNQKTPGNESQTSVKPVEKQVDPPQKKEEINTNK